MYFISVSNAVIILISPNHNLVFCWRFYKCAGDFKKLFFDHYEFFRQENCFLWLRTWSLTWAQDVLSTSVCDSSWCDVDVMFTWCWESCVVVFRGLCVCVLIWHLVFVCSHRVKLTGVPSVLKGLWWHLLGFCRSLDWLQSRNCLILSRPPLI